MAGLFGSPTACDYSMLTSSVEKVLPLLRREEIVVVAGEIQQIVFTTCMAQFLLLATGV
jgi:hypothetical protein